MGPKIVTNCYVVLERKAILYTYVKVVGWLILRGSERFTILDAEITAMLIAQSPEARQD